MDGDGWHVLCCFGEEFGETRKNEKNQIENNLNYRTSD